MFLGGELDEFHYHTYNKMRNVLPGCQSKRQFKVNFLLVDLGPSNGVQIKNTNDYCFVSSCLVRHCSLPQ